MEYQKFDLYEEPSSWDKLIKGFLWAVFIIFSAGAFSVLCIFFLSFGMKY